MYFLILQRLVLTFLFFSFTFVFSFRMFFQILFLIHLPYISTYFQNLCITTTLILFLCPQWIFIINLLSIDIVIIFNSPNHFFPSIINYFNFLVIEFFQFIPEFLHSIQLLVTTKVLLFFIVVLLIFVVKYFSFLIIFFFYFKFYFNLQRCLLLHFPIIILWIHSHYYFDFYFFVDWKNSGFIVVFLKYFKDSN